MRTDVPGVACAVGVDSDAPSDLGLCFATCTTGEECPGVGATCVAITLSELAVGICVEVEGPQAPDGGLGVDAGPG